MSEHYWFSIIEIRQNIYDSCYELFNDSDMADTAYSKIMNSLEDLLSEKKLQTIRVKEQEHE